MQPLYLDALRDLAIEYVPRAQKIRDQSRGQPKDDLCLSLYGTTVSVLANARTSAKEQAAARLLQYVMQLSFNGDDIKLTAAERKRVEGHAIAAANDLCTLTEQTIPWLPAALAEAPEPEAPQAPVPTIQAAPPIALPSPGTMLTTDAAAQFLNVKPQTMRSWASKQTGPRSLRIVKAGRSNTYYADDVLRIMRDGR